MYDIASRLAGHLAQQTGLEQSKVDRVRFGLEVLFGELIKFGALLIVAAFLGLLPETLMAVAGFSLFRLVSGGGHCEDVWRCLVFSLLVILAPAGLSELAAPHLTVLLMSKLILAGAVLVAVLVVVWAPGEVANRRIKPGERGRFKVLALVFLSLWAFVLAAFVAPHSISLAVAGLLGTVVQAFTFTPPGFKAIDEFDIALSRILGERRCPTHAENA